MILDLIVFFLILFFMFLGFKNGFFHTLLNAFGWLVAIVLAALFNKSFMQLLKDNTSIYDKLYDYVNGITLSYVQENMANANTGALPSIISEGINNLTQTAAAEAAKSISDAIFVILSFLLLFLLIKLVFFILSLLISKKHRKGFVGGIDGFFGAILGALQGIATVLIILAIIVPVSLLINVDWYQWIVEALDQSLFVGTIYEFNPLRVIVEGYIPEEFMPNKDEIIKHLIPPDITDMR